MKNLGEDCEHAIARSPYRYEAGSANGRFDTENVGRKLTFAGSRVLETGNDALREVVDRSGGWRVTCCAGPAPSGSLTHDHRILVLNNPPRGELTSVAAADSTVQSGKVKKTVARPAR